MRIVSGMRGGGAGRGASCSRIPAENCGSSSPMLENKEKGGLRQLCLFFFFFLGFIHEQEKKKKSTTYAENQDRK